MNKLCFLLTPLLVLGLLGNAPMSQAQEQKVTQSPAEIRRAATRVHGRRGPIGRMQEQLELSDEQAQKIRIILRDARKRSIKLRADLRVARIELGELVTQEIVDKGKVDAKLSEIGRLSQQRLRLRTDMVLQTREVFTPEQIVEAERWLQRFVSGRGGRGRRRR